MIDCLVASESTVRKFLCKESGQFSTKDVATKAFTAAVVRLSILNYCRLLVNIGVTRNLFTAIFFFIFHGSAWRTESNVEKWATRAVESLYEKPAAPKAPETPPGPSSLTGSTADSGSKPGDRAEENADSGEDSEGRKKKHRTNYSKSQIKARTPVKPVPGVRQQSGGGGSIQQPKTGALLLPGATGKNPSNKGAGAAQKVSLSSLSGSDYYSSDGSLADESESSKGSEGAAKDVDPSDSSVGETAEEAAARRAATLEHVKRILQTEKESGPFQSFIASMGIIDKERRFGKHSESGKIIFEDSCPANVQLDDVQMAKASTILITSLLKKGIEDPTFDLRAIDSMNDISSILTYAAHMAGVRCKFESKAQTSTLARVGANVAGRLGVDYQSQYLVPLRLALKRTIVIAQAAARRVGGFFYLMQEWKDTLGAAQPILSQEKRKTRLSLHAEKVNKAKEGSDDRARAVVACVREALGGDFQSLLGKGGINDDVCFFAKPTESDASFMPPCKMDIPNAVAVNPSIMLLDRVIEMATRKDGNTGKYAFTLQAEKIEDPIIFLNKLVSQAHMAYVFESRNSSTLKELADAFTVHSFPDEVYSHLQCAITMARDLMDSSKDPAKVMTNFLSKGVQSLDAMTAEARQAHDLLRVMQLLGVDGEDGPFQSFIATTGIDDSKYNYEENTQAGKKFYRSRSSAIVIALSRMALAKQEFALPNLNMTPLDPNDSTKSVSSYGVDCVLSVVSGIVGITFDSASTVAASTPLWRKAMNGAAALAKKGIGLLRDGNPAYTERVVMALNGAVEIAKAVRENKPEQEIAALVEQKWTNVLTWK